MQPPRSVIVREQVFFFYFTKTLDVLSQYFGLEQVGAGVGAGVGSGMQTVTVNEHWLIARRWVQGIWIPSRRGQRRGP